MSPLVFSFKNFPFQLTHFNPQSDGPSEILHKHLCLLDLRAEYFGTDHGTKWNFVAQILSDGQGDSGFTGPGWSSHEHRSTSHLLGTDQVDDDPSSDASLFLTDET
jgi:hypothetical protein